MAPMVLEVLDRPSFEQGYVAGFEDRDAQLHVASDDGRTVVDPSLHGFTLDKILDRAYQIGP